MQSTVDVAPQVHFQTLPRATSARDGARYLVLSMFVSTLLFAPQIAMWSQDFNRYFVHWDRMDSIAILTCIVLLGLIGAAVGIGLKSLRNARPWRVYTHVFLIALGTGIISLPPKLHHFHPGLLLAMWLA